LSSPDIRMKEKLSLTSSCNLFRASLIYLILPFVVFCLGFLHWYIGFPIGFLLAFFTWKLWKTEAGSELKHSTRKEWIWLLVLAAVWVILSGIGGYAFQNFDFNSRNAIFRDLINYRWPVYYTTLGTVTFPSGSQSMVYYFGYWLIPALIGKLLGWQAANFILYLYTLIGVILTVLLISKKVRAGLIPSLFLLVFFSGMDSVGALISSSVFTSPYPTLWPPITHLEWWQSFQFSSFTTQLFWVFNQSLPVWICAGLILNLQENRSTFLVWSLCFFYAPIPALGLAVLVIGRFLNGFIFPTDSMTSPRERWISQLRDWLSLENLLGGGLITILCYLFYRSNAAVSTTRLVSITPVFIFQIVLFSLLEWTLIWLCASRFRKQDITWYLMAPTLLISLLFTVSDVYIISRRAPIAMLFLLLVWSGEIIFHERSKISIALILMLAVGALTPLFEIDRSIYRTVSYYLSSTNELTVDRCSAPQETRRSFPSKPEQAHPGTLTADDWCSLSTFDPDMVSDYVSDISNSFFFRYIAKP